MNIVRTAKNRIRCISHYIHRKTDFCPGTYRSRKDHVHDLSGSESSWCRTGENIFYLTAKTITRTVAEEAFSILKEHGLKFKVITITAKEKLCFCDKTECNPENCLWARGHLDRVNDAVFELWTTQDSYDRDTLLEYAKKWQVCPFEMCLDLAVWVDAVICDYNYVFDPNVYLKRFFGEGTSGEYIFLIDEAHNLVDRGRKCTVPMWTERMYWRRRSWLLITAKVWCEHWKK